MPDALKIQPRESSQTRKESTKMAKVQKTCKECESKFSKEFDVCPECGADYQIAFTLADNEHLIYDDGKSIKIAISYDPKCMHLRIAGQPTTYHNNWSTVLIHLKQLKIRLSEEASKGINNIILMEQDAIEWAKDLITEMKKI